MCSWYHGVQKISVKIRKHRRLCSSYQSSDSELITAVPVFHLCSLLLIFAMSHLASIASVFFWPFTFYSFTPVPLQEVSTLLLAASVMGDKMSLLNWLGFAVCLCGISLHVGLKAQNSKRKRRLLCLGKRGDSCFGTRCASTHGERARRWS